MVPAAGGPASQKPLDRHVRDMVNTITNRVSGIPTGGGHTVAAGDDDAESQQQQHGVRVVTLAGTNTGATMRGHLDDQDRNARPHHHYYSSLNKGKGKSDEASNANDLKDAAEEDDEEEGVGTYVNSNFQAVNNSIMFDSHYNTNDPGVHMDISDHHHPRHLPLHRGGDRLGNRRGKKNIVDGGDEERFRSRRHERGSDDDDGFF
ncbi:unnamed protein product [Linum tenue]|uniref:Uncharacterized protein n=1 Tax=Linum tenue TaxID=586396 RepID=A0AAV0JGA1_9ROSI|nr:unnamed protein product [Linum tenue]